MELVLETSSLELVLVEVEFSAPDQETISFKLNVKTKRLARKSAFTVQSKTKDIMVIEDLINGLTDKN